MEYYIENYPHPPVSNSDLSRKCDWLNYPQVGAEPGYRCCAASGPVHRAWRNDLPCANYYGAQERCPPLNFPSNYKCDKHGHVMKNSKMLEFYDQPGAWVGVL